MFGRLLSAVRRCPMGRSVRFPLKSTQEQFNSEGMQFDKDLNASSSEESKEYIEWLINNVPRLSEAELKQILVNMNKIPNYSFRENPELAFIIVEAVQNLCRFSRNINFDLISLITKLQYCLDDAGAKLMPFGHELIQNAQIPENVMKFSLQEILILLEFIGYLEAPYVPKQTHYLTHNGIEIIQLIGEAINNLLKTAVNYNVEVISKIMTMLIKLDRSDEMLLRKLEGFVYPRLSMITTSQLISISNSYYRRDRSDFSYMHSSVLKPLCAEFQNRSPSLGPSILGDVLTHILYQNNKSGVFYDPFMNEMIVERIKNNAWLGRNNDKSKFFLTMACDYLATTSPASCRNTLQSISELYADHSVSIFSLRMAISLTKSNIYSSKFWNKFEVRENALQFDMLYQLQYYRWLQTLKGANSSMLDHYYTLARKVMPKLEEIWIANSLKYVKKVGWPHKAVDTFLKKSKVAYNTRFFNEYVFDFAVPSSKLVIDIPPLKDFVLPDMTPTSNVVIRNTVLTAKGWTVVSLPIHTLSPEKIDSVLDEKLRPLIKK